MDRREAIRVIKELLADRDNDSRYSCVSSQRHYEALDLAIEALQESINKVRQADTLIIAAALRDFAQDGERNISDRERAEELREQVLAYGASMCYDTPIERTGEWVTEKDSYEIICSNCECEAFSEFGTWFRSDYCPHCGAKMKGGKE